MNFLSGQSPCARISRQNYRLWRSQIADILQFKPNKWGSHWKVKLCTLHIIMHRELNNWNPPIFQLVILFIATLQFCNVHTEELYIFASSSYKHRGRRRAIFALDRCEPWIGFSKFPALSSGCKFLLRVLIGSLRYLEAMSLAKNDCFFLTIFITESSWTRLSFVLS